MLGDRRLLTKPLPALEHRGAKAGVQARRDVARPERGERVAAGLDTDVLGRRAGAEAARAVRVGEQHMRARGGRDVRPDRACRSSPRDPDQRHERPRIGAFQHLGSPAIQEPAQHAAIAKDGVGDGGPRDRRGAREDERRADDERPPTPAPRHADGMVQRDAKLRGGFDAQRPAFVGDEQDERRLALAIDGRALRSRHRGRAEPPHRLEPRHRDEQRDHHEDDEQALLLAEDAGDHGPGHEHRRSQGDAERQGQRTQREEVCGAR